MREFQVVRPATDKAVGLYLTEVQHRTASCMAALLLTREGGVALRHVVTSHSFKFTTARSSAIAQKPHHYESCHLEQEGWLSPTERASV